MSVTPSDIFPPQILFCERQSQISTDAGKRQQNASTLNTDQYGIPFCPLPSSISPWDAVAAPDGSRRALLSSHTTITITITITIVIAMLVMEQGIMSSSLQKTMKVKQQPCAPAILFGTITLPHAAPSLSSPHPWRTIAVTGTQWQQAYLRCWLLERR
jgi:hypothetical protein